MLTLPRFCSCWETSPVVTKRYANSDNVDCSFNCDDPYNRQYCGGIDLGTLGFLYSYYAGVAPPGSGGASPSLIAPGVIATPSGGIVSPPATSGSGGGVPAPASSSVAGGVVPPPQGSSTFGGGLPTLPSNGAGGGGIPPQSSFPPGVIVPTPSGSGAASPSATGVGGAPVQTIVPLGPGQPFTINIAAYLRTPGDQALSWIPSPPWLLYNANITSFYGTIPLDFPSGPLIITVTAGQPTTGSNGNQRRQAPAATYTFAIELLIAGPGVPPLPSGPAPTGTPSGVPSPVDPGVVLPSYTNTVYQTITRTITRCPVCAPEVTLFAVPIGTTCITAEVFTTPCEITVARTRADGVVTPAVTTTTSRIPYNPAESTVVVTTVVDLTTKYTTTLLVAVTMTVQKLQPTGEAGAVQPLPPPPAGPPAPPKDAPFAGPVAPPPKGAFGTGVAATNGSLPAPTRPVTAGASMDRLVEMFVLLSGVAFGALLLL